MPPVKSITQKPGAYERRNSVTEEPAMPMRVIGI
jgi:hypothetical protein